jgi:hypothetical protein
MRIKAGSVKPRFDLTGKDGNAFKPILKEMMSGNYENLLNVFEKHFGDYVEIVVADDKDE